MLDGDGLPISLAANAASLGAKVLRASTSSRSFGSPLPRRARQTKTTVVYIETDPLAPVPSSESWWDVPVSEVAELDTTREARATYDDKKSTQRLFL